MLDLPTHFFSSEAKWESWLEAHYASSQGIWLKIAKKDSGIDSLDYSQALTVALCFGWIDGLKHGFDAHYWLQRFTPRRPRSKWSKINREKAQALIAAGRMREAGLREVEAARADGRWEAAYDSQRVIEVPQDFQSELDRNPSAQAFFETLKGRNRYAILYRIEDAKRLETRQRRISQFIAMLNEGRKPYD